MHIRVSSAAAVAARGAGEERAASPPVWRRQLPDIDGTLGLGFLDLMEARFIDAFRKAAVPWRVIRVCAERARELVGVDHPFASQRFRTDGRTIFGQSREAPLLDLAKSQFAFTHGIPTVVLADAVAAEGSVAKVARLFRLSPRSVDAALRFERRQADRLAA